MKSVLKQKKAIIGMIIIGVLALGMVCGFSIQSAKQEKQFEFHISSAGKYLSELNYEQAIAEYTAALEIEPKDMETWEALVTTYLAYADSFIESGDYAAAISVLQRGFEQTEDERLQNKLENAEQLLEEKELQRAELEKQNEKRERWNRILIPIYEMFIRSDFQEIYYWMVENYYNSIVGPIIREEHIGTDEKAIYHTYEKDGYGVAVGAEFCYFGQIKDGKPEGKGIALYEISVGNLSIVTNPPSDIFYIGEWSEGKPNGYGIHYHAEYMSEHWITTGNLKNGMYDGQMERKVVVSYNNIVEKDFIDNISLDIYKMEVEFPYDIASEIHQCQPFNVSYGIAEPMEIDNIPQNSVEYLYGLESGLEVRNNHLYRGEIYREYLVTYSNESNYFWGRGYKDAVNVTCGVLFGVELYCNEAEQYWKDGSN